MCVGYLIESFFNFYGVIVIVDIYWGVGCVGGIVFIFYIMFVRSSFSFRGEKFKL